MTNNTGTWGGDWNVYTYDALNRLVREKEMDTGLTITYGYDSLGNRILEQDSRDHIRYAYNELNQLVEKEAYNRTTDYAYDRRGNRVLETSVHTQENRRTYEWDETNRLVKGTRGPDYGLYTSEYTYNGLGQRVNSTIMGPDKTVYDRDYTIDYTSPEHNDIAEYNVGRYQWQGDKKVHDLRHLYTAAGQRLQTDIRRYNQWSAGVTEYRLNVHEDILGSSTWYTRQENGYNANHHEYTAWGNNTKAPSYNYDPEYRATEPYFTGHPYDGSLNLYYAENRFYDPETGSWLSSDPARDGLNWYEYCGSNPVTCVDPLGLAKLPIDKFFFNKLSGSGVNVSFIDNITNIQGIPSADIESYEERLLAAKYLTIFLMNDPYFKEMDLQWISGAVGNIFIEGYPGEYEIPRQNDSYSYMQKSINAGYGSFYTEDGLQPVSIPDIRNIISQGNTFGIGMYQWTYSTRVLGLLDTYEEMYGLQRNDLTFEEKFVAEYTYMKKELQENFSTNEKYYKPNYAVGNSAGEAGISYRKIVVYNVANHNKAKDFAEAWYDKIK